MNAGRTRVELDRLKGQVSDLSERLEERTRELEAIGEINRALAQPTDVERVLDRIVAEAGRLIRADGVGIAFLRAGQAEMDVGPAVGVLSAPRNRRIPLRGSITGRVVRTGIGEAIADVNADPDRFPLAPEPVPTRSAIAVPLRSGHGIIGGLVVVRGPKLPPFDESHRDVLQRFADQATIAIEQAKLVQRLEQANRTKEQFLATLSHELRTPLTTILLWTDILRADPGIASLEAGNEAPVIITESAELLLRMVNDLLDLGRLEAGRLPLEIRPTELAVVVRQAVAGFRRSDKANGVTIVDDIPAEVPPVNVDPGRLQQAITNLVSNALRFTDPPGRVMLRARSDEAGRRVILEVEDTGAGIPPDRLEHLFDRFGHGRAAGQRRSGGLGIGLALSRALVEAHGGSIRARSELGQGTTFEIDLPVVPAADDPEPDGILLDSPAELDGEPHGPRSDSGGRHFTILVAEDMATTRQALTRILASRGFRVLVARDGEEAVSLTRIERPDAVLMDIAMPNLDGIDALGQLRADPATARIPVAAITALAMPDDRRRIAAARFDAYLMKPFRVPDLLATVGDLLSSAKDRATA